MKKKRKAPPPPAPARSARSSLLEAALLVIVSGFVVRTLTLKAGEPLIPLGVTAPPDAHEGWEEKEPGRGRAARKPSDIPRRGWNDIFWRLLAAFFGDRLTSVAGGVAFFLLLSIFPGIAAFVSLYGLVADVAMVREQLDGLRGVLPPDVLSIIGEQMVRIAGGAEGGLSLAFITSLLLALWSAMAGVKALFQGLNVAYHETEKRNLIRVNLVALVFTLGLVVFSGVVIGAVIVTPAVLSFWGYNSETGMGLLRWPVLLLANMAVLAVLYRYGPSRATPRWRWVTWGSAFASITWMAASWGFSWYLANFANYQATYGSLGAFIGFMVWTWLSVLCVLLGAELNAEMEHQTARDTTTGGERPLGERGALVADTVGPRKGAPGAVRFTQAAAEEVSRRILLRQGKRKAGG